MKISVRLFFIGLLLITGLFFAKTLTFAQSDSSQTNPYLNANTNSDVPQNMNTLTQNVMIQTLSAISCQLAGVDPSNPKAQCLGVDKKTGKIGFVQNSGGAIAVMGSLITMTLNPPVHTSDFIAYVRDNFGITKPSYAATVKQETGFDQLSPLMNAWIVFRNLVYLIFVLIFIIIGFAIMLRIKIDPRTVMTIQNQIPKLIIGILFVTFSFAIAGLLVDVMWVAIYLIINVLTQADPNIINSASASAQAGHLTSNLYTTPLNFANDAYNGGILGVATNASTSIANIILSLFSNGGAAQTTAGNGFVDLLTNPVGTVLGAVIGGLLAFVGGILAFIVITVAILWSLFRLWFALLSAYIFTLVDVIFAPFWIIGGLIPGTGNSSNVGFSAWLRDMLGNLSAFPVTIAMFLIGKLFIDSFGSSYQAGQFVPPLIGNPGATNTVGALIALGVIFTTPHVVNITKAAFKAPKIDLGPIGQAVSAGVAYPTNVVRNVGGTIAASREVIALKEGATKGAPPEYGERKLGRAFIGRMFGRG